MKRFFVCALLCVVAILSLGACNSNYGPKYTVDDLTAEDYKYIDIVYESIEKWDVGVESLGEIYYADAISFFEFKTIDKMSFYINFQYSKTTYNSELSSTRNSTIGFFILDDALQIITDETFKNDNVFTSEEQANFNRHSSNKAATLGSGTEWIHDASDDIKYQIIEKAYVNFLNKYK